MEGTAWDARHAPPAQVAARTAQQPGLILAAAWVGGSLEGCPWRFFGDHRGAQGGVRACERGDGSWVIARGVMTPWFEARALGALSGERDSLGSEQALRVGCSPGVVQGREEPPAVRELPEQVMEGQIA